MTLPRRIPKPAKRASRWVSPGHRKWVGGFACSMCGYVPEEGRRNEAAHVRNGSGAGMGQKPDDWRCVSLCGPHGAHPGCHATQHKIGEDSFWVNFDVEALIAEFIRHSPKRREIEAAMAERENGR